jgi:large subunit ribosomal protein L19
MKNIEEINNINVKKIQAEKKLPEFFPGDIINVLLIYLMKQID